MSDLIHLRQRERLQDQRRIGELEGDEIAAVLPEQE